MLYFDTHGLHVFIYRLLLQQFYTRLDQLCDYYVFNTILYIMYFYIEAIKYIQKNKNKIVLIIY